MNTTAGVTGTHVNHGYVLAVEFRMIFLFISIFPILSEQAAFYFAKK